MSFYRDNSRMKIGKIAEAIAGMTRTYTFVFNPEPEGGYTVT